MFDLTKEQVLQTLANCEKDGKKGIEMGYVDITHKISESIWGVRAAERNAKMKAKLEREHNVRIGDEVKIITEEISEEKDGRRKKEKKVRKATVVDLYENFILLRIKTKTAGNSFCESFVWKEFETLKG